MIIAFCGQQFFVRAAFDNLAVPHHENEVGIFYGGEPVCNDQRRAPLDDLFHGILYFLFRETVHRGGGFIQDENPGVAKQGTREGEKLFLAGGEQVASLAHIGIQSFVQF